MSKSSSKPSPKLNAQQAKQRPGYYWVSLLANGCSQIVDVMRRGVIFCVPGSNPTCGWDEFEKNYPDAKFIGPLVNPDWGTS